MVMGGILDLLVPREKKFLKMLGTQSDVLLEGAIEFKLFVMYFNKLKKEDRIDRLKTIKDIEHKGDYILRKIIDGLHETFITPLDREDIYNLTQSMDDILDFINESSSMLVMYNVKKMPDNVREFVGILATCCNIIKGSMHHLNDYKQTKKAVRQLHNLEIEADNLFYRSMEELFENHGDAKELIKLKDIYRLLEEAIDKCNRIGRIIEGILVKHG